MKKEILKRKEASKNQKFPPPQNGPVFVKMWNSLINVVINHARFNEVFHLSNLETLCSLYQEEKDLMKFLKENGPTYAVTNARGQEVIRLRPEKANISTVRAQIRSYCKALGLDLDRKKSSRPETPAAKNDLDTTWE